MSGVDKEPVRLSRSAREARKNAVEDAHAAPANKPVVQSLMGTILPWRVPPAKPVLDHKYDPLPDISRELGASGL